MKESSHLNVTILTEPVLKKSSIKIHFESVHEGNKQAEAIFNSMLRYGVAVYLKPVNDGEDCAAGDTESRICYNKGCPGTSLCI